MEQSKPLLDCKVRILIKVHNDIKVHRLAKRIIYFLAEGFKKVVNFLQNKNAPVQTVGRYRYERREKSNWHHKS